MLDKTVGSIKGFIKIIDRDTKAVIVETTNDVLYGNMSMALAHSLIGNPNTQLFYMGLGNGAAYVNTTGTVSYKPSLGGGSSLIKKLSANLYNTVYVKSLSNDGTAAADPSSVNLSSIASISSEDYSTNYEDIIVNVVLDYNEPTTGLLTSTNIQQTAVDGSTFIGTSDTTLSSTFDPSNFVFNEIALYGGIPDLFGGGRTATMADVSAFVGSSNKYMLTHAVFHPVQKAANRSIEIIYTLRIQMGV